MPLSAGTIVAGYRIERVLGSGGMGVVYLARQCPVPRQIHHTHAARAQHALDAVARDDGSSR
ncbi:hypothetical protein MAHJHV63_54920 [Mycobacterium avium subsp. hominissuis]